MAIQHATSVYAGLSNIEKKEKKKGKNVVKLTGLAWDLLVIGKRYSYALS